MKMIITPILLGLLLLALAGCSDSPYPGDTATPASSSSTIPISGYEPQAGDESLQRGEVFLELDNSDLLIMESYPIQVNAILNGNLPTPCNQLRVVVTPANASNEINLEVYTVVDSSQAFITVLEPFSATVPLGSYAGGHYSVFVNGELLGEFDA